MNERIFKLALKAMDFHGAVDTDTELKLTNSELEKFAELIVREYAAEADKQTIYCRGIPWGRWIKEHFGVKE